MISNKENFITMKELECKCCGEEYHDKTSFEMINNARNIAGIPFIINSGHRCKSNNIKSNGANKSSHLKIAFDIAFKNNKDRLIIISALIRAGFKRIGVYKNKKIIHADNILENPYPSFWVK